MGKIVNQKEFFERMYDHEVAPLAQTGFKKRRGLSRIVSGLTLDRETAVYDYLEQGQRFLDVGCGKGNLVLMASQKFSEVYGIDIASNRIQIAEERAKEIKGPKITFITGDVSKGIPFDNGFFDAVSCVVTLEYVFNPVHLCREFNRIVRPGGSLVIVTSNVAFIAYRVYALLGKPPRSSSASGIMQGGALHHFTLSSLESLIKDAGFSVVKKGNIGILWFLRSWWLSLLASGLIIKAVKRGSDIAATEQEKK